MIRGSRIVRNLWNYSIIVYFFQQKILPWFFADDLQEVHLHLESIELFGNLCLIDRFLLFDAVLELFQLLHDFGVFLLQVLFLADFCLQRKKELSDVLSDEVKLVTSSFVLGRFAGFLVEHVTALLLVFLEIPFGFL